jgi:hypothetical protein|uniref:Uncharacterized protein n=2 Tax=Ralstonia pickettii TaxID=329 RepID=C6BN47_RALP1
MLLHSLIAKVTANYGGPGTPVANVGRAVDYRPWRHSFSYKR